METNTVYAKLYDIVEEQTTLSFSKELFLATKGEDMKHCDLLKLRGLSRRDFIVGMYAVVLRRLPGNKDVISKAISENLPEDVWKSTCIKKTLTSAEYLTKGMSCINNLFVDETSYHDKQMEYRRKLFERMYRIYQKSPQWIKKIEKRLAVMAGLTES